MTKKLPPKFFHFYQETTHKLNDREVIDPTSRKETRQAIILGMLEQMHPEILKNVPYRFIHYPMNEDAFWDWCFKNWKE